MPKTKTVTCPNCDRDLEVDVSAPQRVGQYKNDPVGNVWVKRVCDHCAAEFQYSLDLTDTTTRKWS